MKITVLPFHLNKDGEEEVFKNPYFQARLIPVKGKKAVKAELLCFPKEKEEVTLFKLTEFVSRTAAVTAVKKEIASVISAAVKDIPFTL